MTCSDKFIRTTECPENLPMASIKLVFPTPGLPSNKTRKNCHTLRCQRVVLQFFPEGERTCELDMHGLEDICTYFRTTD